VTNPSAGVVVLVNRLPGFNVFITSGSIHILNMTEKAALSLASKCRADSVGLLFSECGCESTNLGASRKVADENQLQAGSSARDV